MEAQLGVTLTTPSPSSSGNGQQQQRFVLERRTSCLDEDQMELVGALTNYIRTAALRHVADCFRLAKVEEFTMHVRITRAALFACVMHGTDMPSLLALSRALPLLFPHRRATPRCCGRR